MGGMRGRLRDILDSRTAARLNAIYRSALYFYAPTLGRQETEVKLTSGSFGVNSSADLYISLVRICHLWSKRVIGGEERT